MLVLDRIVGANFICLPFFLMDSECREALPPTICSDERPRYCAPCFLDSYVHFGEFSFPEPWSEAMVVQIKRVSGLEC